MTRFEAGRKFLIGLVEPILQFYETRRVDARVRVAEHRVGRSPPNPCFFRPQRVLNDIQQLLRFLPGQSLKFEIAPLGDHGGDPGIETHATGCGGADGLGVNRFG